MSRREKIVPLKIENGDGGEDAVDVKVFEIRPLDVYKAYDAAKESGGFEFLMEDAGYVARCTDLGVDKLKLLYPGDIELLIAAFKEVNSSFLAPWPTIKKVIQKVGLVEWLGQVIENSGMKAKIGDSLTESLKEFALDLPSADTSESGNTDGAIS